MGRRLGEADHIGQLLEQPATIDGGLAAVVFAINALRWEATLARLASDPQRLAAAKPEIQPGTEALVSLPAVLLDLAELDREEGEAAPPQLTRGLVVDRHERSVTLYLHTASGYESWSFPVAEVEPA
jgi:hypothetical protein